MTIDIAVQDEGSIVLLRPRSERGTAWLEEKIGPDNGYQPYWPTVTVERRYVGAIIEGAQGDGLVVGVD